MVISPYAILAHFSLQAIEAPTADLNGIEVQLATPKLISVPTLMKWPVLKLQPMYQLEITDMTA